mgnify:CR=1 FL=1
MVRQRHQHQLGPIRLQFVEEIAVGTIDAILQFRHMRHHLTQCETVLCGEAAIEGVKQFPGTGREAVSGQHQHPSARLALDQRLDHLFPRRALGGH